MRKYHVLAFLGAAVLSVSACADPSIASSQAAANTVTVQGSGFSAQRLTPGEAEHMRGTFRLDDGRVMVLSTTRNRLFAELDGKREELVPRGQNSFSTRESGTRLTFDQVPFPNDVVVSTMR
jgi:zona occludens toxin (predicted ATPase)